MWEARVWRNENMEIVESEKFKTKKQAEAWGYDYMDNPAVSGQLELDILPC